MDLDRSTHAARPDAVPRPGAASSRERVAGESTAQVLFSRHANDCAMLAYGCSMVLGLSLSQCSAVAQAAWLHDVGELVLPRDPGGNPLAPAEADRPISDAHCRLGAMLINDERATLGANAQLYADVAMYHHERWDGSGFPFALTEERIPFAARIVGVVDHYIELIRASHEAPLFREARAIREIREGRDTLFDPRCADGLVNCLGHDLLGKARQFSGLFSAGLGSLRPLDALVCRALAEHRKAAFGVRGAAT
jgi:response regulator RpfG family c-di-GMP phosphodiesterase